MKRLKNALSTIRKLFVNSFFYYLAIELAENVLEDFIAYEIATVFMQGLSVFLTVTASYGLKSLVKFIVKKITYKEGNDKLEKVRKIWAWLVANKKTLGGRVSAFVSAVTAALGGTGVIDVSTIAPLYIAGFNITPILFYLVLFILVIIGVNGKGQETVAEYQTRKEAEKLEKEAEAVQKEATKEAKAVVKEAKAKMKQQQKDAKKQAKQEAENKIKEAEAQAKAEHDAKVEEAMKQLLAKENEQTTEKEEVVKETKTEITIVKEV